MKSNGLLVFIPSSIMAIRFDQFKTGPEGLFNNGAVAAIAIARWRLFTAGSLANVQPFQSWCLYWTSPYEKPLYKTWSTATAQNYENWGTADLDLRINNKSSAALVK